MYYVMRSPLIARPRSLLAVRCWIQALKDIIELKTEQDQLMRNAGEVSVNGDSPTASIPREGETL